MSSVDNRVVKMTFDNAQFERNASASIRTIERLKKDLTFDETAKSLRDATSTLNKVDFNGLSSTLEKLNSKFTTFGTIGRRVIENMTDDLMNFAKSMTAAVADPIISGGSRRAFALENARFTLQGLLPNDADEVQKIMDAASESVSGTAYALNDAASAAAQFAASGLRSGDELNATLKAIAGTAATANAEYSDIAHIFTIVAGNGRLMTEQLNQLSFRGLNGAATLTDAFNNVLHGSSNLSAEMQDHIRSLVEYGMAEVKDFTGSLDGIVEGDLRKLVTAGTLDFKTFSAIMAETFGDHAKDANKTFNGSMANIRAALARTGAMFYSGLIVQEGPIVKFFNSIREAINALNNQLQPLADLWTDVVSKLAINAANLISLFVGSGGIEGIGQVLRFLIDVFNTFTGILGNKFGINIKSISDQVAELAQRFRNWASSLFITEDTIHAMSALANVLVSVLSVSGLLSNVIQNIFGLLLKIGTSIFVVFFNQTFTELIGEMVSLFRDMSEALKPTGERLWNLQKFFVGIFDIIREVGRAIVMFLIMGLRSLGRILSELFPSTDLFYDILGNIGTALTKVAQKIYWFFEGDANGGQTVFDTVTNSIIDFIRAAKEFANTNVVIKTIRDIIGSFNASDIIRTATANVHGFVGELNVSESIIEHVKNSFSSLIQFIKDIAGSFSDAFSGIESGFGSLIQHVRDIAGAFSEAFSGIENGLSDNKILGSLGESFNSFGAIISRFASDIPQKLDTIRAAVAKVVNDIFGESTKYNGADFLGLGSIAAIAFGIKKAIDKFKGLKEEGEETASDLKGSLKEIKDAVLDTFGSIQETLKAASLIGIAVAIGILAFSLYQLAKVDAAHLIATTAALAALMKMLTVMLGNVQTALEGFDSVSDIAKVSMLLISIGAAALLLANAMVVVSEIDSEKLLTSLLAIVGLLAALTGVVKVLADDSKGMAKGLSGLIFMAIAIELLVKPLKELAYMDPEALVKGVLSIVILISALAVLMYAARGSDFGMSAGIGIVLMAAALKMIMTEIREFAYMNIDYLVQGVGTIIALIAALSALMFASRGSNFDMSSGIGIVLMAAALKMIMTEIRAFAEMDINYLVQGVGAVIALIAALSVLMFASQGSNFGASAGAGVLLIAVALRLILEPVKEFAAMDIFALIAGVTAVSALILVLAFAIGTLTEIVSKTGAVGAAGLLIMAVSILMIAGALAVLAAIPFPVLLASVAALAIVIAGFALAAVMLSGIIVPLLLLSAALVGLGVAMLAVSVAVALFVATFPMIGVALLGFLATITALIDPICKAINEFIRALADAIENNYDDFYDAMGKLLEAVWHALEELVKRIGEWIAENGPGWLESLGKLGGDLIQWLIDGITGLAGDLWGKATELAEGFIRDIENGLKGLFDVGANAVQGIIEGLKSVPIVGSVVSLGEEIYNGFKDSLDEHSPSKKTMEVGEFFVKGFIIGIAELSDTALNDVSKLAESTMDAFEKAITYDYSPTIAPVVDVSNVQNGIASLSAMFGSIPSTYGIESDINDNIQMNVKAMENMSLASDYSSILAGMSGLRDDLAQYNEIMSKMRIIMDTGTIVGALTPGIDRELGRNAVLAGRRV